MLMFRISGLRVPFEVFAEVVLVREFKLFFLILFFSVDVDVVHALDHVIHVSRSQVCKFV